MKKLTMRNEKGVEKSVEVDDATVFDYGGFGSVFEVPDEPNFVVKRIDLTPPQPIGNISRYVAHIRTTKERLLGFKAEEENKPHPRRFICNYIDEVVEQALSTHWCFDIIDLQFGAVWFLQKRAPGRKLLDHFRNEPPPINQRLDIARDVINRMRTLRRADLIHLDCVADNIFVDLTNQKTTMIDLDGCGVVRRSAWARPQQDEWEHPPFTLGHLNIIRPPTWYPQIGIDVGPKAGNYLFAERWVVIDTVIRILTWNRVSGALSWVEQDTRQALVDGYRNIKSVIDTAKAGGSDLTFDDWNSLQNRILAELRSRFAPLPPFSQNGTYPSCLGFFANLAQEACFDPRMLKSENTTPYDMYLRQIW
jgi:hypothetical protein